MFCYLNTEIHILVVHFKNTMIKKTNLSSHAPLK